MLISDFMEQHPVPQNVTTFQFRLVGDMTLKQFGYLALGALLAFICYKLPLPFFFTYPLAAIAALGGFGLAFVPVEERPMDVWIMAFLKNVYSPTQWVWQHTRSHENSSTSGSQQPDTSILTGVMGKLQKTMGLSTVQPVAPIATTAQTTNIPVIPKEYPSAPLPALKPTGELVSRLFGAEQKTSPQPSPQKNAHQSSRPTTVTIAPARDFSGWLKNIFKPKTTLPQATGVAYKNVFTDPTGQTPNHQPQTPVASPIPVITQSGPAAPVPQVKSPETEALEANLHKLKKELEDAKTSQVQVLELQKKLSEALSSKTKLEIQMAELKNAKVRPPASTVLRPAGMTAPAPAKAPPTIRVITPESAVRVGLPRLTTFPNIVTGIIKDPLGNLLSGILVTVRDKNEVPLRALKSNKLGQFAASTPLPNGNYFIEVEDPRGNYTFDRVQISVTGAVLPPLEIFAKSQKQINRDKLAAEIFGSPKPI